MYDIQYNFGSEQRREKDESLHGGRCPLDTQWNWDIQTTIKQYVWNTLSQNLYLLDNYPNYVFNFEGAVKYSWMKEYYPDQYEKMKKYIANGRWHLTGSGWDANETVIVSPESWLRNILLGQSFYRTEFGKESTDIFLPDCFGFSYFIPTLASHCGLIGFSTQNSDGETMLSLKVGRNIRLLSDFGRASTAAAS